MDSCQGELLTNSSMASSDNNSNQGGNNFGQFARELGCSTSQAADYAHEIDDAMGSVGLKQRQQSNNDNDNNIMVPPQRATYPATAADILRSKAISHAQTSAARHIVSFSQPLDTLLGGGFALSELTEIVGLPGVGKTQLAMQLCVDSGLPANNGGVEGCAVVIDAEGSWSSASGGDRLWSIAGALVDHVKSSASKKLAAAQRAREGGGAINVNEVDMNSLAPPGLTQESILEGIHIFRVHDEASQTCTLYNLPKFLLEQEQKGCPVRLLVIDSMAFHYRVASSAGGNTSNSRTNSLSTTHNLTRMAAFLTELAAEFDLAVVAMNHLTTRIDKDGNSNNPGGTTKLVPALGESWAHSVTSRLMIDHHRFHADALSSLNSSTHISSMGEVRNCTLVKSPHKPTGTALFMVTDKGIRGIPPQFLQSQSQATTKRARLN